MYSERALSPTRYWAVRAYLIHETFSAHQEVEDDDMNMICLGGLVVGHALAWGGIGQNISSGSIQLH